MAFGLNKIASLLGGNQLQKVSPETKVIGVSGSFGKASVASIIYHCLHISGETVGWISTRGVFMNGKPIDPNFIIDNVDAAEINKVIKYFSDKQVKYLVVEITPTQSYQKVFKSLQFDSVVVTEMTDSDLPEVFQDKQSYFAAVFQPIAQVINEGLAVINTEIKETNWIRTQASQIPQSIFAAWVKLEQAQQVEYTLDGSKFAYLGSFVDTKLIGKIGVLNTMLAMQICMKYLSSEQVDEALFSLKQLPGRMEVIQQYPFSVIVDYGTNPTMVNAVYDSVAQFITPGKKIITVGGINGKYKKPNYNLGKTFASHSEIVLLANNDCGEFSLEEINQKLLEAAQTERGVLIEHFSSHEEYIAVDKVNLQQKMKQVANNEDKRVLIFDQDTPHSRLDAIDFALRNAKEGDMVIIFGKGEDKYLDCGKAIYEWNDANMTRDLLRTLHSYSN